MRYMHTRQHKHGVPYTSSHKYVAYQARGLVNCRTEVGLYRRPEDNTGHVSEPLIMVFATSDMAEGDELLMSYGSSFFAQDTAAARE
jgi:hypothetical protein